MITLYNGDCTKILETIPDNSIDCIVTSPPYNKSFFLRQKKSNQVWGGFDIKYSSYSDDMPLDEYEEWMINIINLCMKKLKSKGSMFFNHKPIRYKNKVYFPLNFIQQSDANVYQEIIWNRKNSPNIRNDVLVPCTERIYWLCKSKPFVYRKQLDKQFISEVWSFNPSPNKLHPAPFPVELPYNCISLTTQENEVILDPFMGSGTTGVAAKMLNRKFIGIEFAEDYFNLAKKSIESA